MDLIMKKSIILAVSFSLLFIVCGKSSQEKSNAVIEEIDGITYVHNIGEPQYPDRTVEFLEEVTFGSEEDEVLLGIPSYFSVRSNGNIYISDFSEKNIKVYNSDGRYLKTIGIEGQGPGEFQTSPILRFLEDGRMLALDMISRRCSFYDKDDNLVESFNWEGYKAILHAISDTLIIFTETSMDRETMESKFKLTMINFDGKDIKELFALRQSDNVNIEFLGRSFPMPQPYSPLSIIAADEANKVLYHCRGDKFEIEIYDFQGNLMKKYDVPYTRIPITEKDKEEYLNRIEESLKQSPSMPKDLLDAYKSMPFPETFPVTNRMIVDYNSNLWLRLAEKKEFEDETNFAYAIFDKEGNYTAKVWTQYNPQLFVNDAMYTTIEDNETGLRTVKRYKIQWKDN